MTHMAFDTSKLKACDYSDPVGELRRRFPDLAFRERWQRNYEDVVVARAIEGRWTVDGCEHGVRIEIPFEAGSAEVERARQMIARQALFNCE